MLIYVENSALLRLWDDPKSLRVAREAAGIREVLRRIEGGQHRFLLSGAVVFELYQNSDVDLRGLALAALPDHDRLVPITPIAVSLATGVAGSSGLTFFDALHVVLAAIGGADVMFTTDDGILAASLENRRLGWGVRIANPTEWKEVLLK